MAFCIPRELSKDLLRAVKSGDFTVNDLLNGTSKSRREIFQKYTDESMAQEINAGFESALASKSQQALNSWAEKTFSPNEKKTPRYKTLLQKISNLKEEGFLSPQSEQEFYEDLIATQLGATVTAEEVKQIDSRAKVLEEKYNAAAETGMGELNQSWSEYFKAKNEMDKYLLSITPASNLKIATGTIGRGSMLFSIKSPVTNIVGNTVNGLLNGFTKRLASGNYAGANNDYANEYVKYAIKMFNDNNTDITRMYSLSEGRKTLGEQIVHSEGEGNIRKIGRFYEDIVFKKLMSGPDIVFSAIQFADTANLASTAIAKSEGLQGEALKARALEIFKDAAAVEPTTISGEKVRAQAIADAEYATFTNDSQVSKFALGIRDIFNKLSGDARLGDQLLPFVKTPANVVAAGVDYSGITLPKQLFELPGAIKEAKTGNPAPLRAVTQDLSKSFVGLSVAFILSNLFDKDDFVGAYPTSSKERELLELRGVSENSVRIGDNWYSLDYFGPIAVPLVGMLYAKKYGTNGTEGLIRYGQGVLLQTVFQIPGVEESVQGGEDLQNRLSDTGLSTSDVGEFATQSAIDFVRSRSIPGFINDAAEISDNVKRETKGQGPLARVKASIPGLRQTLPARENTFGEEITANPWYQQLFAGSRVTDAKNSPAIEEFVRLQETGNLPSITDPKVTSTRVKDFQTQVSEEKFNEAMDFYYRSFRDNTVNLIGSSRYNRLSDEDRAKEINRVKDQALDRALKRYGYKKPKK